MPRDWVDPYSRTDADVSANFYERCAEIEELNGRAMAIHARENATTTTELTAETFRELQRRIAEPGGPAKIAAMPVAPAYRCNYQTPVKAKVRTWVVASKQLSLDAVNHDVHRKTYAAANRLARQQYEDRHQALVAEARQAALAKFKRTERAYPTCQCGKSVELIFQETNRYEEQGYFVCKEQWTEMRKNVSAYADSKELAGR